MTYGRRVKYRVLIERVASETLDGEVVILDQVIGNYFSLTGAGAHVWDRLLDGATVASIIASTQARFDAPEATIADSVRKLVDRFVEEELLETLSVDAPEAPLREKGDALVVREPWVEPHFERFTDLQSLLLLDPIHDVDGAGWPSQPPAKK
jgi:hypothetical protein